jgi:hypothetical protein
VAMGETQRLATDHRPPATDHWPLATDHLALLGTADLAENRYSAWPRITDHWPLDLAGDLEFRRNVCIANWPLATDHRPLATWLGLE